MMPTSELLNALGFCSMFPTAVLEGAGGVVVDLQGVTLHYGKPDVFNPSFIAARDAALIPT